MEADFLEVDEATDFPSFGVSDAAAFEACDAESMPPTDFSITSCAASDVALCDLALDPRLFEVSCTSDSMISTGGLGCGFGFFADATCMLLELVEGLCFWPVA